jgi:hypothetical protein
LFPFWWMQHVQFWFLPDCSILCSCAHGTFVMDMSGFCLYILKTPVLIHMVTACRGFAGKMGDQWQSCCPQNTRVSFTIVFLDESVTSSLLCCVSSTLENME